MSFKMKKGSLTELQGCTLGFLQQREHHAANRAWTPQMASTAFLSRRMDVTCDLYKKDLYSHYGCVNAIEFSPEGDLLISGGDDRRVLLWDLDASLSGSQRPKQMKGEHSSNIFCLSFDSQSSKIYSAGNDEQVIVHDLRTGETVNVFMHEEAVYGVCVNPCVDSVFASAGEDGQVLLYDIRAPVTADPLLLARNYDAFYSVQFHPTEPTFVVTANSKEGVGLWDVRKPRVPVIKYGEKRSPQSSMSAKFNRSGSQIVALRRRLPPVLFDTHTSSPVCQFDADHYYNSCTMKSCCFAGVRDQFILSGSDDFNLYMWRIPDHDSKVNLVSEAHMVLQGHRSIVNQVRFNPQSSIIASSGVEKIIKLWSPMPLPGSSGGLSTSFVSSSMSRKVYTHEEYIGLVLESEQNVSHDYSHGCTDEDPRMMAFFDSLVQREVEGWTTNTDLSDEDDIATTSDVDTETTTTASQSSITTSHSDNSDSDTNLTELRPTLGTCSSLGSPSTSTGAPLPIRKRRSWCQLSSSSPSSSKEPATKRRRRESLASSPSDLNANKPSSSTGSEWILRLIAKKRAQLKAAKKEKKKRRRYLRKNQRYEKRSFLKCFTSSRRYLYHPERSRSTFSERIPEHLSGISRRRQVVAPYTTIMVFDENQESDENEGEGDQVRSRNTSSFGSSLNSNYTNSRRSLIPPLSSSSSRSSAPKKRIWSSNSSCSSEDEKLPLSLPAKESLIKHSDSDSDLPRGAAYSDLNNIVSEIIDSENNSDVEDSNTLSKDTCQRSLPPPSDFVNDPNAASDMCNANLDLSESQIPLDINIMNSSGCNSDIIPISSISTDEAGSVLFGLNNLTKVNSGLHLDNIDLYLAPTTPKGHNEDTSNDSNDKSYTESGTADTPDSGISMTTSNGACGEESKHSSLPPEKDYKKQDSPLVSDLESQGDLKDDDSDSSSNARLNFSLKRQILKTRLKNYRRRVDDV